ncbi:MAG: glycosyltransferase, partial [Methyloversatilis sp.]|nr:glycosyltransferase [Methyloversatilis sp.]
MLSVVIPAHNAARWIADAIASVQSQPLSSAPDIVVVANHCSDDTADIARAAGARVIDSPAPGPAAARNAGVAAGRG